MYLYVELGRYNHKMRRGPEASVDFLILHQQKEWRVVPSKGRAGLCKWARCTSCLLLVLQQDALQKAGCGRIFTDTASGAKTERKGLEVALSFSRAGNTLVVWRLD